MKLLVQICSCVRCGWLYRPSTLCNTLPTNHPPTYLALDWQLYSPTTLPQAKTKIFPHCEPTKNLSRFFLQVSVTRLGDFLKKFLATNFLNKTWQLFGQFLRYYFKSNICCGYFWAAFGKNWATLMLQHLVTLLQTNFSAHRAKQTTLEASDAETREREVNFRLFPYFEEEGWTFSHFFSTGWAHPENTHLLRNGKYHHTADLLFDWFGFNQTWKSLSNST